jgi:ribosomal protein S18 acetylase RimI-like enzyme
MHFDHFSTCPLVIECVFWAMAVEIRKMQPADLGPVNNLLVRAFTPEWQMQRQDGVVLPLCTPPFLAFYRAEMPGNCWVAAERDRVRAAVFAHRRGRTGWLGPLAVAPEWQGRGLGKKITRRAIRGLEESDCQCIGLETNAVSIDNVAFYSRMGFRTGPLTVDLSLSRIGAGKILRTWPKKENPKTYNRRSSAGLLPGEPRLYSRANPAGRQAFLAMAKKLTRSIDAMSDYSQMIELLHHHKFGDSFLYLDGEKPLVCATVQTGAVAVGERSGIGRLLALTADEEIEALDLLVVLADLARRTSTSLLIVRIPAFHAALLNAWAKFPLRHIHMTVRLYWQGCEEHPPARGWHLNKWE